MTPPRPRQRADRALVPVTPDDFDEQGYLDANPDVAEAVAHGAFGSGRHHYTIFGRHEDRLQYAPSHGAVRLPAWAAPVVSRARGVASRLVPSRSSPVDDRLASRVYDLEVEVQQLRDLLELVGGHAPPPPKHLQVRVVGNFHAGFVRSGLTSVIPQLNRALAPVDRTVADFSSILDFGCGCGRSIFALSSTLPDAELHGADIDAEAIAWLREHHAGLASYEVCPTMPPTPYGDDSFDFVFGISVLTHLPEDMQFAWLEELRRITRPGGFVVLTTHGPHHYGALTEPDRQVLADTGFLYLRSGYGVGIDLPEFYETTFHSHDYIRREWTRCFDVVDIQEPVPGEHQDLVLLRVPSSG